MGCVVRTDDVLRGGLNTARKMGCQGWISFSLHHDPFTRVAVRAVGQPEGGEIKKEMATTYLDPTRYPRSSQTRAGTPS